MARQGIPARETAAAHLEADVPTARPDERAADALRRVRARPHRLADAVYVLDAAGRLAGVVPLADALRAPPDRPVSELMVPAACVARLEDDQEFVAGEAARSGVANVPVVDAAGRFAGVVPAAALLAVLRREHVEDLHRLAGIVREEVHALEAIEEPPARRARHRLPWLLVGLAGSIVAALVVARFETVIEAKIAVAFFLPAIVYLADAIGTQTEAVVVRGLLAGPLRFGRVFFGEVRTGLLIGLALGGALFLALFPFLEDTRLAAAVALAVVAAGTVATTVGLLLPYALDRLGRDPAFGSGPVATVIQDVLSLLIYFLVLRALGV